jgi:hypothetical protein
MRKTKWGLLGLLAALAAGPVAGAEKDWSVLSGSSVGQGHLALHFQAGWPELSLGGHLGLSDKLDVGARLAFDYGGDGSVGFGSGPAPGFRLQAVARYQLLDSERVRLGASFAPGFGIDYLPGLAVPRIVLPVRLAVGIALSEPLAVHVALDFPLYVTPGTFGGLTFPIQLGGGAEYRLSPALAATLQLRAGPVLELTRPGAPSHFAMLALAGLAYRL